MKIVTKIIMKTLTNTPIPIDQKILDEVVRRIVEAVHPLRIILFGSAARGEMRPDSDLDLLIVMPDESDCNGVTDTLYLELMDLPLPKDIIVTTNLSLIEYGNNWSMVYYSALREGIEIYADTVRYT